MSKTVKLAAVLPADTEVNGIDHIKDALIDSPDSLRYAVVAFRVRAITENVETRVKTPTIEVERIEYAGDTNTVPEPLVQAMVDAAQDRLGHNPLPFDSTDPAGVEFYPDEDRDDQVLED